MKAAQKNLERDPDFYRKAGKVGGTRSHTGGFYYAKHVTGDIEHIRQAGSKGGKISKRTKKVEA